MSDLARLLDELDAAQAKATRGWNRLGGTHDRTVINDAGEHVCDTAREDDAALIVAAANALPRLTAALRAVETLAVEWNEATHPPVIDEFDRGLAAGYARTAARLRAALAAALTPGGGAR